MQRTHAGTISVELLNFIPNYGLTGGRAFQIGSTQPFCTFVKDGHSLDIFAIGISEGLSELFVREG